MPGCARFWISSARSLDRDVWPSNSRQQRFDRRFINGCLFAGTTPPVDLVRQVLLALLQGQNLFLHSTLAETAYGGISVDVAAG